MTNQLNSSPLPASADNTSVVICVAPNGARRSKADHPALPMTGEEIGREAALCAEAGASVIHLHVRGDDGSHTLDVERYKDAIVQVKASVRERMLIQVTTEAVGRYRPHQQMDVVRALRPQAASVAIRELIPDDTYLPEASRFFDWASHKGVALQFIVYSPEEASQLRDLARRGALGCERPNTLFVLGRYTAGQRSEASDLLPFLRNWPRDFPWSVCAFGPTEAQCMAAAIALGGHVRVGFENNLHHADGSVAQNNASLVLNIAGLAGRAGRRVASPEYARKVYGATQG